MDDFDEPLQAIFSDHVDSVYRCLDALSRPLDAAVEKICRAMLDEHRVLVCGCGTGTALAQLFCSLLLVRARIDRPALPTLCIGADAVTLSSATEHLGLAAGYARQLQAVGQAGDALVVIAGAEESGPLASMLRVAQNLGMVSIVLSGGADSGFLNLLTANDIELRIPTEDSMRLGECQLLILNSMATLIESRLFGGG